MSNENSDLMPTEASKAYSDLIPTKYCQHNGWKVFFDISSVYLVIGLSLYMASIFNSAVVWFFCAIAIGISQVHLANLGHHASHREFSSNVFFNDNLARLFCSGPIFMQFDLYRYNHLVHHESLGTGKDSAKKDYYDLNQPSRNTPKNFLLWIISGFFGNMAWTTFKHYIFEALLVRLFTSKEKRDALKKDAIFERRQLRLADSLSIIFSQLLIFVIILLLMDEALEAYFILWLLPGLTIMPGIISLRACLEHAGLHSSSQLLYDFQPNFLERVVFSRFGFHLHGTHHVLGPLGLKYYYAEEANNLIRELTGLTNVCRVGSFTERTLSLLRNL